MTDTIAFELTTKLDPPKKFRVDGEEFQLLSVGHLSPKQEAEAMALFSRHSILSDQVDATRDLTRGAELAELLRSTRLAIISALTTIPLATASTYPLPVQVKLLESIQGEMNPEADTGPKAVEVEE